LSRKGKKTGKDACATLENRGEDNTGILACAKRKRKRGSSQKVKGKVLSNAKLTKKQQSLLDAFEQAQRPLTAHEAWESVGGHAAMGLATVYRAIAKLTEEAGFPPGVFNVLPGYGEEAGAALVAHHSVDKIGFTGSVETARKIVQGSVSNLKRVSLELGGKSPNIVFADADLEEAAIGSTWAIFGNNGQSCTAGSRLYIERSVFNEVLDCIRAETQKIKVGPGMSQQQPNLGPVVSDEQLQRVMGYINEGAEHGAQAITGGGRMTGALQDGYFIEPTIFTNVNDTLRISREEIFGPVVCAMPFDDVSEIVNRANDTDFGLAAGLWTTDVRKAHSLAKSLRAGTIWINTWGNTEAASPFGGYKQSGYGREMGKEAMDLYTEVKSVWVKTD